MYNLKRLNDIRSLELFLFGGIPETPTPMYELNPSTQADVRKTRDTTSFSQKEISALVREKIGEIEINHKTGELKIRFD